VTGEEENTMAKILYLGTAGSDDPTRAGFPFQWAIGARDAGHDSEIFLAGEATYLMKHAVAGAILPVGMPALRELIAEVLAQRVPIFV
jgi:predicted peroxiredoxin